MQELSYRSAVVVTSLPTPTTALAGVTVRLQSDNKPYWCNGTAWVDLSSLGSGTFSVSEVTLTFGTVPIRSKRFAIADGNAVTSSKIIMTAAPDSQNYEFDAFVAQAYCAVNGTITAYVHSLFGPVKGSYKFNYIIG